MQIILDKEGGIRVFGEGFVNLTMRFRENHKPPLRIDQTHKVTTVDLEIYPAWSPNWNCDSDSKRHELKVYVGFVIKGYENNQPLTLSGLSMAFERAGVVGAVRQEAEVKAVIRNIFRPMWVRTVDLAPLSTQRYTKSKDIGWSIEAYYDQLPLVTSLRDPPSPKYRDMPNFFGQF